MPRFFFASSPVTSRCNHVALQWYICNGALLRLLLFVAVLELSNLNLLLLFFSQEESGGIEQRGSWYSTDPAQRWQRGENHGQFLLSSSFFNFPLPVFMPVTRSWGNLVVQNVSKKGATQMAKWSTSKQTRSNNWLGSGIQRNPQAPHKHTATVL